MGWLTVHAGKGVRQDRVWKTVLSRARYLIHAGTGMSATKEYEWCQRRCLGPFGTTVPTDVINCSEAA